MSCGCALRPNEVDWSIVQVQEAFKSRLHHLNGISCFIYQLFGNHLTGNVQLSLSRCTAWPEHYLTSLTGTVMIHSCRHCLLPLLSPPHRILPCAIIVHLSLC